MTVKLRKIGRDYTPGYRVEVDSEHAGDVFATEHPIYPSRTLWYSYLPESEYPLDPTFTRREAVDSLVWILEHKA